MIDLWFMRIDRILNAREERLLLQSFPLSSGSAPTAVPPDLSLSDYPSGVSDTVCVTSVSDIISVSVPDMPSPGMMSISVPPPERLCAYALLRQALRERYHWRDWPALARQDGGKPFFPDYPQVCFSISHTRGAALVALADYPVGVDIQRRQNVSPRLIRRLHTTREDFFSLWVRREARIKRRGGSVISVLSPEPPLEPDEIYWPLHIFPGITLFSAGAAFSRRENITSLRRYSLQDWPFWSD